MSIGDLRSRISFESNIDVADGIGGFTRSWITAKTVWAYIEPASASERYFANRVEENITHKIFIRSTTGLNASMRIKYGSRIFQIKGIKEDKNRHRFFIIDAIEDSAT